MNVKPFVHVFWSWAGLVPAIPITRDCAILIEIAGTSPAMTPQVLLLLRFCRDGGHLRIERGEQRLDPSRAERRA